ncbi:MULTISPECIES: rod shape-determining protein MreD [Primorskyibacter]|uniref:Rod shape-determining protein MreD n=1 Tax=Primorskyibacter flagellatus TaxID=1387277 RepID=A0A1W1ZRL1_9RHOB|nr:MULTISPECIES: rod shape-determining protein MreD [Primorskyibacter]SMC50852.1 rod shape-determining protein MreD [Primorskyibacter flagellatus]
MVEQSLSRVWTMRAAYIALCLVVIFFHLLPLETAPRRWAAPDLMVALSLAWAIRRPEYVPAVSIAGVMLLADLMFQRPPGLWAALMVITVEWLKRRQRRQRDASFAMEWLTVVSALTVATLANRLALLSVMYAPGSLYLALMQLAMTAMAYPFVVMVSRFLFGVRHASPGEVDTLGRRI